MFCWDDLDIKILYSYNVSLFAVAQYIKICCAGSEALRKVSQNIVLNIHDLHTRQTLQYLRLLIHFSSKCFSQTCRVPAFIWRRKSLSISRFRVITRTHSSRVLIDKSSFPFGREKILIPLCLLFEPQPKMLQFAPTMTHNGEKCAKIQGGLLIIPIVNDAFVHSDFNNG